MTQERAATAYWMGKLNNHNLEDDPRRSCLCVGPQDGQPLCLCRMKNTRVIDGQLYEKVTQ